MHIPPAFSETRGDRVAGLLADYPLGMVSWIDGGHIEATPLPLLVESAQGEPLRLTAHLPRANPLATAAVGGAELLITFSGPRAYVSPSWYPTKREHGRAVPTWNYAIVTVRGVGRIIDDAGWVKAQIRAFTSRHETGREEPWSVDDAPSDYIDGLVRTLVGLEVTATEVQGKWKVSQNQPDANRIGVAAGLRAAARPDWETMARLVEQTGRD